jgi:hypothetical protein
MIKMTFVLITFALAPGVAMAQCQDHARTTMSCSDGKVFDADAKACVPVSG